MVLREAVLCDRVSGQLWQDLRLPRSMEVVSGKDPRGTILSLDMDLDMDLVHGQGVAKLMVHSPVVKVAVHTRMRRSSVKGGHHRSRSILRLIMG